MSRINKSFLTASEYDWKRPVGKDPITTSCGRSAIEQNSAFCRKHNDASFRSFLENTHKNKINGIQTISLVYTFVNWIPAFAGMTVHVQL